MTVAASVPVVLSGGLTVNQGGQRVVRRQRPGDDRAGDEQPTRTVTLTDNGTVSFAAGDTVSLYCTTTATTALRAQIVVGNGGLLQATGTTFNATTATTPTAATTPRSSSTPAGTSRPAAAPSPSARSTSSTASCTTRAT